MKNVRCSLIPQSDLSFLNHGMRLQVIFLLLYPPNTGNSLVSCVAPDLIRCQNSLLNFEEKTNNSLYKNTSFLLEHIPKDFRKLLHVAISALYYQLL